MKFALKEYFMWIISKGSKGTVLRNITTKSPFLIFTFEKEITQKIGNDKKYFTYTGLDFQRSDPFFLADAPCSLPSVTNIYFLAPMKLYTRW